MNVNQRPDHMLSSLPAVQVSHRVPGGAVNLPEVRKDKTIFPWPIGFIILTVINLIMISGVAFLIYLTPQKALRVKDLRTKLISTQISEQDEALLNQALDATKADREKLEQSFPNEKTLLSFIKLIDQIRNQEKVKVIRFSLDSDRTTKIGKNQSFLPMTLILKGPQRETYQEFKKIVDSPYFIRNITFNQEFSPDSDEMVIQTQFHLFVSNEFKQVNP